MFEFLYNVCIAPLVMIIEVCYVALNEILGSEGWAVVGISVIVTILTLPLYDVAERWQQFERDTQARLKGGVDRIKAVFKGDEQYMILSTYYRQNHYHPMMALRSSFGLLIQVPFFIAAYNFLSNLESLKGISFLFIRNLGEPDSVITLSNGFSVNILPILMTTINCIAGAIYTKGFTLREKLQIYGMALIFLVLLYNSPSALVLYWTMNNVLSLVKNIVYKLRQYMKIPDFLLSLDKWNFSVLEAKSGLRFSLFILSAISLAVLAGIVIPSFLIESEVVQYCYIDEYSSPLPFLIVTFAKALGIFVLWPSCFYFLFSSKVKRLFALMFPSLAIGALVNSFMFSGDYGPLYADCTFMSTPEFIPSVLQILMNGGILLMMTGVTFIVVRRYAIVVKNMCAMVLLALLLLSVVNMGKIFSAYNKMTEPVIAELTPVLHLSKTEKNVVVLMIDGFASSYIPSMLEKEPHLKELFSGFTWYPNTVTLGHLTMVGIPGVLGGYDFSPYEVNLRVEDTLQKKYNEAILSMPVVFNENGFTVTLCDIPYENYLEYPIEQMYNGYSFVNRVVTHGTYSKKWKRSNGFEKFFKSSKQIHRNFIWFSIFKVVPPVLRQIVYHGEYWLSSVNDNSNSVYFINNYSTLDYLPDLTAFDAQIATYHFIDNETSHYPVSFIDNEKYIPSAIQVDFKSSGQKNRFDTQMAIFLRLSEWFNYLRSNGVYDNTRIILVSDHGAHSDGLPDRDDNVSSRFISTLMVKDFDATGTLKSDLTFMTNADTPALATAGIIEDARNPFTYNLFDVSNKKEFLKIAAPDPESTRIRYNTQWKINPEDYWTLDGDDVYDESAWRKYFEEPTK